MIDLTVPDMGQNGVSPLWEEPYVPQLTGSGIAMPPVRNQAKGDTTGSEKWEGEPGNREDEEGKGQEGRIPDDDEASL